MLKKFLILSLVLAAGVSPFLPNVFADNASWKSLISDRVWDESAFRVDRLTLATKGDVMKRNGIAYISNPSAQCVNIGLCDKIDLSVVKDGFVKTISGVDQRFLSTSFAVAQKGKFVFSTTSVNKGYWFDVWFMDPNTNETHLYTSLTRKPNELSTISFATSGERLYTSLLQTDEKTKQVQSSIVAKSTDGKYEERNLAFLLNAPWQQVMDAYNDQMLVKFQFSGGNKQLWVIHTANQATFAVPNTWVDPQADIFFPHFLSNGSIAYFQNYRLYTFNPAQKDVAPVSHATLNWNHPLEKMVQIQGDSMVWVDAENTLWSLGLNGVSEVLSESVDPLSVRLLKDSRVSFVKNSASLGRTPMSVVLSKRESGSLVGAESKTAFLITDTLGSLFVGTDEKGTVWMLNEVTGQKMSLGQGTGPVLTDATHVLWKGVDGALYQATLHPILFMRKSSEVFEGGFVAGQRVKAIGDAHVYVFGNDGKLHWIVSEPVAEYIFGSNWNKGITDVHPSTLWQFENGVNIDSLKSIQAL